MCGIVGISHFDGKPVDPKVLRKMTDSIAHRGPDDEGHYTDGPLGLGHRRLAIIDLSFAGHQPMQSKDGRYCITYNGEIYNFRELRKKLKAKKYTFRSSTDTEVLLNAYVEWGEDCLKYLNGMFAFGVWDRKARRLFLARDRYGIKPLYWYCDSKQFVFASEIKALFVLPGLRREICYSALNEYFTFQNTFSDVTLFRGVHLLPPGHTLTLEPTKSRKPELREYWDYHFSDEPAQFSEEKYAEELCGIFSGAVTRQLISDVPLGSYLSAGIDSGFITSIAARHLPRLRTFTCGFDLNSASGLELGFDERQNAETLSNLFKTEQYEVVMHAGDMEVVLPDLIWHLEDLRVGQSYPNYYVARLASKFVKVVLSGAGGDELFAGYPWRYYTEHAPLSRENYLANYYQSWQRLVSDEDKKRLFNQETFSKIAGHSTFETFRNVFKNWTSSFNKIEDLLNASLYFELKTFLPGLLLVEEKLSMAHSLETRVPFLDDRLVDFAMRIPARYKLRNLESSHSVRLDENEPWKRRIYQLKTSEGKAVLRQALSRVIPPEITVRTKQGFSAPDASWFRGESINFINRLLGSPKARLYEFLRPQYIAEILDQHRTQKRNRRLLIWSFLCFEWWLRKFL